jgi:hypothetical protein
VPLSDLLAKESEATVELKLVPKAKVGETPGSGFVGLLKIKFACSPIDTVRSRAVSDMFSRFDRDGNGRLDAVEFAQFQSSLSTAGSSVFGRVDQNKDGWVDIAEVLSCVEQLIPDEVVADYFVKEANNTRSLLIHHSGQQGTALTEEQAGRGWFVSMTEWVSRDKYGAGLHVGRKADHIVVYNRAKGLLEEETIDPALAFSMKALIKRILPPLHASAHHMCSCYGHNMQVNGRWTHELEIYHSFTEENDRQPWPSVFPPGLQIQNVCSFLLLFCPSL